jgi:hypothetical protein
MHSSINQPSPASSATSTSSSLRTPPDLLIAGATLSGLVKYGKQREDSLTLNKPKQYLTVSQLEARLKILARVTKAPIVTDDIPSSPPLAMIANKKRRADEAATSPPAQRRARRSCSPLASSTASSQTDSLPIPHVRDWTKEAYISTAVSYRHIGRELKHRGDRRLRDSSSHLTSPLNEALIAGLEQTDALLLYTYGFWCEDQGNGTCVAANWHSIYALLRYVYQRFEKSKMATLSALCRLLEASILRHVSAHEMRMLHHRMGKVSSSMSDTGSRTEFQEISSQLSKVVGDQERCTRLYAQARPLIANITNLRANYPRLAKICESTMQSASWSQLDQPALAARLDPGVQFDQRKSAAVPSNAWSWPLDVSTPFPMLVCFGRALLREVAREAGVEFNTEHVDSITDASTAGR